MDPFPPLTARDNAIFPPGDYAWDYAFPLLFPGADSQGILPEYRGYCEQTHDQ